MKLKRGKHRVPKNFLLLTKLIITHPPHEVKFFLTNVRGGGVKYKHKIYYEGVNVMLRLRKFKEKNGAVCGGAEAPAL